MKKNTVLKMSVKQFREFASLVMRSLPDNLSPDIIQQWIDNQNTLKVFLRKMLIDGPIPRFIYIYNVTVDYSMSIEELIKEGRYDRICGSINSQNFPTKKRGKKEESIELVNFRNVDFRGFVSTVFGRSISTKDVLKELDRMGYKPADIYQLLALGAKYPDLQRNFQIIALNSVCYNVLGNPEVPGLFTYDSRERCLGTYTLDVFWEENRVFNFACVRK